MKLLERLEDGFVIALFLGALAALTAQLLSRYFLVYQFPWTEELARFLFTWFVFFGAANIMRRGDLIAVTLAPDMLPDRPRAAIAIVMHLIGAVFFAVLVWTGVILVKKVAGLPTIAMGVSSSFEYAAVPAASLIMCARSLRRAFDIWRNGLPRGEAATLI